MIALIAGLTGMLAWGVADFFAKKTIDQIGDIKTLIASQFIGGSFLTIYFLIKNLSIPSITLNIFVYILILAVLDSIGYLLLYKAFQKGVMSIVSPIAASAAGFSVIVSFLIFKEKITSSGLMGIILIFLGILVTSTDIKDLKKNLFKSNLKAGVLEALGVMVFLGLWFVLWDNFISGKEWIFWLLILKFLMGILLSIYFYFTSKGENLFTGYKPVIWILIPVAILDVVAYLGTTWGYSVSSNTTGLITVLSNAYSVPVIILSYIFLKERVTIQQFVGICCIILGIIVSSI